MSQIAGIQDFRQEGPPGDIGVFQGTVSVLVYSFTFSGVTYVVAQRMSVLGWTLVSQGTVTSTVINDALNALTAGRTWKEKVVVKGNYILRSAIELPSYTILEIQGKLTLAPNLTAVHPDIIHNKNNLPSGNDNIEIIGGILDGNWQNGNSWADFPIWNWNAWNGIYLVAVSNVTIKDVIIKNAGTVGLHIDSPQGRVDIENIRVITPFYHGGHIGTIFGLPVIGEIFVRNSYFEGPTFDPDLGTVDDANAWRGGSERLNIFENCIFAHAWANGLHTQYAVVTNCYVSDVSIETDTVPANRYSAIQVSGWGVITDNVIDDILGSVRGTGIRLSSGMNSTIANNRIINAQYRGISAYLSDNVVINGNVIVNSDGGIELSDKNFLVVNNIIQQDGWWKGIIIAANATVLNNQIFNSFFWIEHINGNLIFIHNIISGGSPNLIGGTRTIKRNIGYVTENTVLSPAFAIDGVATVTVTIPHGLAITPAIEDCSLTVVEDTNVDDWGYNLVKVDNVGAINVVAKVHISVASATGGATAKLSLRVGKE